MNVACFCGCCFSFDGDLCACPACGEYATLTHASKAEEKQMRAELDLLLVQGAADAQSQPSTPPYSVDRRTTFVPPSQRSDAA
jgi:hypothetical protein